MDQRAFSTTGLGLVMLLAPFTLGNIPVFSFPMMAKIAMAVYSAFIVVGGILESGADRYKFFIDGYLIMGIVFFLLGAPTGFPLGEGFWTTMTLLVALFAGLPAVLLLHLNRKNS
jgi:hypothetical protein